ncbi:molybdopterin biosynthesis protein [Paenibacillus baekrokdamisoli]|uniref:Molybdopterin molybdenumtransferase n=1 Tax=Paenibacillus baekrokdamisoli TaxID=1712516 RepID=A0A3G9J012_9BACL|nr:molybdopterin-binding protein [Paenibacillus baekrokdamisoli]MBB3071430.1 molybdenum cofactor synthesis domain-containing protein [Paenibacillus baekrokdamisoli]BBH24537.1 molybdopterin biosynthesis protein [Paenibacillus baekrokdamisoli]
MSEPQSGTSLKEVPVKEAIGLRLAHDLTQIIPGQFKGRLFKKGHIVTEADIPRLLDIGKEHIYIMQLGEGDLHEDEAAMRMAAALQGQGTKMTDPHEGKVAIKSDLNVPGLAVIDASLVHAINHLGEIALATLRTHSVVMPGGQLAATRVVPLFVPEEKVAAVEELVDNYRLLHEGRSPVRVRPLRSFRIGLLTTGGEVFSGRIQDKFGPAVRRIVEALGSEIAEQRFSPDDRQIIVKEIHYLLSQQYDMIVVTGGMSVDPDDRTPAAIKEAGASIVSYGTPMLPGSMLLIGYLEGKPIMGLPGCVMHDPYTSFDALLPRILAGDVITREDIVQMGYGGLHGC